MPKTSKNYAESLAQQGLFFHMCTICVLPGWHEISRGLSGGCRELRSDSQSLSGSWLLPSAVAVTVCYGNLRKITVFIAHRIHGAGIYANIKGVY